MRGAGERLRTPVSHEETGVLFWALASAAAWTVTSLTSSWLASPEAEPTQRPFRFPPDGALSFVLTDEESFVLASLLRPAVLAAAPALVIASPAAAVLLPALAFVLTRRRVELRLSLG